jgi:glycosyl transferase family 87
MGRGDRHISTPLLLGLGVLSILGVMLMTFGDGWNPVAIDFQLFWRAVQRPISHIYDVGAYFVYPPPSIILFKTLRFVPLWTAYFIWSSISVVTFFLAAKRLTNTRAATLALFSSSSLQGLLFGQTPMLLSGVMLFALTLPSLTQGLVIGYLAAIKPQLFIMAPLVMLIRRDLRGIVGMALGGIVAILLSLAMYGIQPWLDWFAVLPSWAQSQADLHVLRNAVTWREMGIRFGASPLLLWSIEILIVVFVVLRLSRVVEGVNLAALIVTASALSAPYALPHDLTGAMPALSAFILSGPATLAAISATMMFVGLGLPIILPSFAFVAAWRMKDAAPFWSVIKARVSPP